jgi:hypothetical protein
MALMARTFPKIEMLGPTPAYPDTVNGMQKNNEKTACLRI